MARMWKQLEGEDIMLLPYSNSRASTARRLHCANRELYKLFTPGPHCGHFPCGGLPPRVSRLLEGPSRVPEGGLKAGNGPLFQTWPDILRVFSGCFEESGEDIKVHFMKEACRHQVVFSMVWILGVLGSFYCCHFCECEKL